MRRQITQYCLLLLSVWPWLAAAQTLRTTATLKGTVTDSLTREPLIHAVVRVAGVRDTLYTVTDREGAFAVSGLSCPQDCHITGSFPGYGTH
ncbi:carboxypeptidase-like regulatory domain-containing protein [Alistipes sp.]|uniref:carboxypeptidase-like regulatory domain-containing protein n=1 Tax=Alistipes sp. TaxID=1872444 RepID=UPI003AF17EB9